MLIEQTGQGKVRIYDAKTGDPLERWPVDAREMVASGEFTYERPTKGKKAEAAAGPVDGAPAAGEMAGPQFDPVQTPSMDPIMGAPSGEVEMQLGAATGVSVGVAPEGVAEVAADMATDSGGARASAVGGSTDSTLPKTTPLGEPATYSRAADAGPALTDQIPVRRGRPKGGR